MKKRVITIVTMMSVVLCMSGCSKILTNVLNNNNNGGNNPVVYENPDSEEPSRPDTDPFGQGGEIGQGELTYNFEAHNPNAWQAAYKTFLEGNTYGAEPGDYGYYFLADIDDTLGSNIPELCIRTGAGEAAYVLNIYSYNPVGETVDMIVDKDEIGAGHSTFYVGPSGDLYRYYGHMGYLQVDRIELNSGKASFEMIYEEDINGDPEKGYTSMSEIFGEDTEPVMTAPFNNYAALIWYLNLPVETASMMDGKAADLAFSEVLAGKQDVYACGDEYYNGLTGVVKLTDLMEAGAMSKYDTTTTYEINMYCYTDANFDGLSEIMLRLLGTDSNNPGADTFAFILLSFQDGQVYAYVMPNLTYDGSVIVCEYSVYHNWYFDSYDYFIGVVFDKDVFLTLNTDNNPKVQRPYVGGEATWEVYDASVGY
jgi:hypothetical protein